MKKKKSALDRDYLRRGKYSTPEQRLNWLAAAVSFAHEARKNAPFKPKLAKK